MKKQKTLTLHTKARNPYAPAARARQAGEHGPAHPARHERRQFKRQAAAMLARGGYDA